MKCVSLCSGIGGLELGLSMVSDCHPVAFVEKDQYCRQVLSARFPGVELHTSIEDFAGRPCDLITAGFPCQPWSCAGKQKGQDDERWIWDHIERIVRDSRPGQVFLENVPGLVSGGGLAAVLWSLASLGFDAVWGVFSCAQLGAPHHRRRVFILANADSERLGATQSARFQELAGASGHDRVLAYPDLQPYQEATKRLFSQPRRCGSEAMADADHAEPGPRLEPGREQEPSPTGCGFWDATEQGKAQFQNLRMAVLAMIQTESYLKAQKDGSMSASTAQRLMQAFVSLSCVNPAQSYAMAAAVTSGPSQKRSLKRSEAAL